MFAVERIITERSLRSIIGTANSTTKVNAHHACVVVWTAASIGSTRCLGIRLSLCKKRTERYY